MYWIFKYMQTSIPYKLSNFRLCQSAKKLNLKSWEILTVVLHVTRNIQGGKLWKSFYLPYLVFKRWFVWHTITCSCYWIGCLKILGSSFNIPALRVKFLWDSWQIKISVSSLYICGWNFKNIVHLHLSIKKVTKIRTFIW